MILRLIDKEIENFARKFVKFVLCSMLGLGVVFYNEQEDDYRVDTFELAEWDNKESFNKESFDEGVIKVKSYEIVKDIYDEVA